MKFIKTKYFDKQVVRLKRKYIKIEKDLEFFEKYILGEPFSDLGFNIFKYRIRNSSIPIGKRGGFRIIVKKHNGLFLPLCIYSKTIKENISEKEIFEAFDNIIKEL